MGFGVKYTGPDGRKRSFEMDSVPKAGSELADIVSGRGRFPDFRRAADQNRGPAEAKADVEVMPGGGVVKGRNGMLCLMGEENSPLVDGVKLFSSVNGRKGYHTLDEIDMPTGGGARVGPEDECDQEDPVAGDRMKSDGSGWATSVTGRLIAKREKGHTVIYQYSKDLLVSPGQRLVGVTAEHRRVVGLIPTGDGGDPWPFSTKWVGTDEDGGWAMYLPSGCVTLDGNAVDVSEGLEKAYDGDEEKPDWYMLGIGDGEVWIEASRTDEDGNKCDRIVGASLSLEPPDDEASLKERFKICEISKGTGDERGTVTHIQTSCLRIANIDACQPWPYMVRRFGEDGDGEGTYGMYLPEGCLVVDGKNMSVSEGMIEVEGAPGWFALDADSGPVSIRITRPRKGSTDDVEAEIFYGEASPDPEDRAESVYKLCEIYDDHVEQIQASRLFVDAGVEWDELSVSTVKGGGGQGREHVNNTLQLLDFQEDGFWSGSFSLHTLLFEVGKDEDYNENTERLRDSHVLIRRKQQVGEEDKYVLEYLPIGRLHRPLMELDEQRNKSLGMRWDANKEAWILWCDGGGDGGGGEGGGDGGGDATGVLFTGTDGSQSGRGNDFEFESITDGGMESNVVVKCGVNGSGHKISIGAYYV